MEWNTSQIENIVKQTLEIEFSQIDKKQIDLYTRKIQELQRKSHSISSLMQSNSLTYRTLISIALMELSYRLIFQEKGSQPFPLSKIFTYFQIKPKEMNEYRKILEVCKQYLLTGTNEKLPSSSQKSEISTENPYQTDNYTFLDPLCLKYSLVDKIIEVKQSSPSDPLATIKQEVTIILQIYKTNFYDRLPSQQQQYVRLQEKIYPLCALLLFAELLQVKMDRKKIVEVMDVTIDSIDMILKKMKAILETSDYYSQVTERLILMTTPISSSASKKKKKPLQSVSTEELSKELELSIKNGNKAMQQYFDNQKLPFESSLSGRSNSVIMDSSHPISSDSPVETTLVNKIPSRKRQYDAFLENLNRSHESASLGQVEEQQRQEQERITNATQAAMYISREKRKEAFHAWREERLQRRKQLSMATSTASIHSTPLL